MEYICGRAITACKQFFAEFCNAETFRAQCDVNEVIVMTSAVYGRMALGRCVEEDVGFLGCHNDARDVMDVECSGRRECEVLVSIKKFWKQSASSCRNYIAGYISASYECVAGTSTGVLTCMSVGRQTRFSLYLQILH